MKVAIDSGPLTSGDAIRGIGVHTRELVSHLKKIKNLQIDVVDFSKTDLSRYDIAHYQYFHPHFLTLPFSKPTKKVIVTIHDLIRLIYPKAYPAGIKGYLKFFLQKYNLRNVDAVITISETSKKDIVRFLGISPQKIHVIYLAPQTQIKMKISPEQTKKKYKLPGKFVLYIGDVNYNKNLLTLAKACKIAKFPLVIIGKQAQITEFDDNPENASWSKFLSTYKNDKDIIRLGFLEKDDFEAIFKLATVYCQPSYYEGFGLPLLEAFERQIPVVAAKNQAHVEICDEACFYVDPYDPSDMAKGLIEVITNNKLRAELIEKGNQRVKKFAWSTTAEQTYAVYKKV